MKPWFNLLLFLGVAAFSYGLTLYFDAQAPVRPPVITQPESVITPIAQGQALPEFSFKTSDDVMHHSRDFKGKIIILNFWASWCPPCVKEFPSLLHVAQKFPDDVVLIALSSDLDEGAMKAFLKKQSLESLPPNVFVALDDNQAVTQKLFQAYRLPETVLVDRSQIMRHKIAGIDWTSEEMIAKIEKMK